MSKLHLLLFLIIIIIISCKDDCNVRIYSYRYLYNEKKELKDSLILKRYEELIMGKEYQVYKKLHNDSSYYYITYLLDEKHLIYFDDTCNLVDQKIFNLNSGYVKVSKYYLDRENSADEESYIYYNPKIGIIGQYNFPWGRLDLFEYNSTLGLKEILLKDTTGFIFKNFKQRIDISTIDFEDVSFD